MNISALLAGLFSGVLGAMGLGGGSVLIIYLTLFTDTEQLSAQGINLLFFIPIALLAVIIYSAKRKIRWRIVIPLSLWGVLGATTGIMLTKYLGGNLTSKLFGGLLILMGLFEIFKRNNKTVAEKKK